MVYGLFTSKFKPRKKTDKMAGEAPLPPQACLPQAGGVQRKTVIGPEASGLVIG